MNCTPEVQSTLRVSGVKIPFHTKGLEDPER